MDLRSPKMKFVWWEKMNGFEDGPVDINVARSSCLRQGFDQERMNQQSIMQERQRLLTYAPLCFI
jgi:hypothetical protein